MMSTPHPARRPCRTPTGFTLVELIIVVLILGIIATMGFSKLTYSYDDATLVTLQHNLVGIYEAIELNSPGEPPPSLESTWFRSNKVPRHPQASDFRNTVETVNDPSAAHPTGKVLRGALKPYWYNSANGIVRARVASIGGPAATLDFYNAVNGSSETSLGNYAVTTGS